MSAAITDNRPSYRAALGRLPRAARELDHAELCCEEVGSGKGKELREDGGAGEGVAGSDIRVLPPVPLRSPPLEVVGAVGEAMGAKGIGSDSGSETNAPPE